MSIEQDLHSRCHSKCELCSSTKNLATYPVPPKSNNNVDSCVLLCTVCMTQIEYPEQADLHHWRCLNDSMWNPIPAVQVMAWRMLTRLSSAGWPQDLLDTLYLDDETLAWAQSINEQHEESQGSDIKHLDSNGTQLNAGDTVTLIKDLNVKGANFTAKRGTAVRNISLIPDNAEHIEGKVSGQQIVILTKFVKKSA